MRTRTRQRGEIVVLGVLLILGLAFGSGLLTGKKNEQRKAAGLPAGQTIATWETPAPAASPAIVPTVVK